MAGKWENPALTSKQQAYSQDYFWGCMTMKDIAEKYGVNVSTVSRTIRKAVDKVGTSAWAERMKERETHENENATETAQHGGGLLGGGGAVGSGHGGHCGDH